MTKKKKKKESQLLEMFSSNKRRNQNQGTKNKTKKSISRMCVFLITGCNRKVGVKKKVGFLAFTDDFL